MKRLMEKAFCIVHSFSSSTIHLKYSHHLKRQRKRIKVSEFSKTVLCHLYIFTVISTGLNDLEIVRTIFLVNIYSCSSLKTASTALTHGYYYCFPFLFYTRQKNRNSAVQSCILNYNVRISCIKLYTSLTYITGQNSLHVQFTHNACMDSCI